MSIQLKHRQHSAFYPLWECVIKLTVLYIAIIVYIIHLERN